jgi:hypothetical protein
MWRIIKPIEKEKPPYPHKCEWCKTLQIDTSKNMCEICGYKIRSSQ